MSQPEPPELLVPPDVSKAKFDEQIATFAKNEETHRRNGCWLLKTAFPNVSIAFAVPQTRPVAVAFAVRINFDNYDLWPPSVRYVDPFTDELLLLENIPPAVRLNRGIKKVIPGVGEVKGNQPMLIAHRPEDPPFVCMQGIREYHDHPSHTGDSWLIHKGKGAGTLHHIVDQLHKYGVRPLQGFQIGHHVVGLAAGEAPA